MINVLTRQVDIDYTYLYLSKYDWPFMRDAIAITWHAIIFIDFDFYNISVELTDWNPLTPIPGQS